VGQTRSRPYRTRTAIYQAFLSTPGGTRTPNLLIRRWPSGVRGCPRGSTHPGTGDFPVHPRPYKTAAVHAEWLPARASAAVVQPGRCPPRRAYTWRERLTGSPLLVGRQPRDRTIIAYWQGTLLRLRRPSGARPARPWPHRLPTGRRLSGKGCGRSEKSTATTRAPHSSGRSL